MQSPAISNKLGWFGRVFNRQAMRSVHFLSFAWFVFFILGHGAMVFVTGLRQNTNHMFGGVNNVSWAVFPLFVLAMAVMVVAWLHASPFTIRHARTSVAVATSSIEAIEKVDRQNGTPNASAARAAAISPLGQVIPAIPTGPSASGIEARSPAVFVTVDNVETSHTTVSFSASASRSVRFRWRVCCAAITVRTRDNQDEKVLPGLG